MYAMPYIPAQLAAMIRHEIQILLPAARAWVLHDYLRSRRAGMQPQRALHFIRDAAAVSYLDAITRGADPPLEQAARYAAAAGYLETLWDRSAFWWRAS